MPLERITPDRVSISSRLEKLGLVRKKEGLALTGAGYLACLALVLGAIAAGALFARSKIISFLAPSARIQADALVVEGWIPDYSYEEVKSEFQQGGYQILILTGNPILKGEALVEYGDFAHLTRAALIHQGWNPNMVVAVSSQEKLRNRTYAAALALRGWILSQSAPKVRAINIMSFGVHTRRTWLLYQRALKGVAPVGAIAGRDLSFDPRVWWKSSQGVRAVIDETIAYFYARWLFRPEGSRGPDAAPSRIISTNSGTNVAAEATRRRIGDGGWSAC